jgi:hypothetical protein
VPVVNADAARWSNASSPAHSFEARFTQGTKEHTGQEGTNAGSKASQQEGRVSQEQGSH